MKLSVLLFTYNQEQYIHQAIDNILYQKVNFNYQVIIADDGSTDNTPSILNEYQQKHPDKILLLESKKNGIIENIFRMENSIQGEYIAILDGDDYWNYEYKLQSQIDFLDKHPDYIATFHDASIISSQNIEHNYFQSAKTYSQYYQYNETIYPSDLLTRLIIPTGAVVFRKQGLTKVLTKKELIDDFYSLDWKIYCLLISDSKFHYFNEVWSIYRNHSKGISKNNKELFHFSHIKFLNNLLKDPYYQYFRHDIYSSISNEYRILLYDKNIKNKPSLFRSYFINELKRIKYFRKIIFE
ncbi:MAG: glycosyltransferase [Crocinitomicaceae bacterium]|nr:glycosyltransferase [Crocinitomicaceae bacterium]